jgi:beta-galactosidase GanA
VRRLAIALGLLAAAPVIAQTAAPIPKIVEANGRHALLVDGKPFLIMGAQAHNSSAWPAMLPKVWPAMDYLGVNTVELPVYWEQIEPAQGRFDFSVVDTLIAQAREHHVRLVLLWFGTWKNGSAHYRPAWMKARPDLYPNIVDRDGKPVDSPSPHSRLALDADVRAFSAFMGHLKQADPQRTVIMVQVENEPGSWGSVRDFLPAARKAFAQPVPSAVLRAMGKPAGSGASWQATFGADADEYFHAYSIAHYIDQVAAAGKAIYPLPMYVNVALKDPFQSGPQPGYEYGGATFNVIPIWKAAAPSIDVLAPDIYQRDDKRYLAVLDQYARPDNPLFVPETISAPDYVRFFDAALARGAIGFAPFGIDYTRYAADRPGESAMRETDLEQLALSYHAAGPMMRDLAQWSFDGKLKAAIEDGTKQPATLDLGDWQGEVRFGIGPRGANTGNDRPIGRILVAQLAPDEFVVTGNYAGIRFKPVGRNAGKTWEFLSVEEGQYIDGTFHPIRIWNGDETDYGLNFSSAPQVLRVRLSVR